MLEDAVVAIDCPRGIRGRDSRASQRAELLPKEMVGARRQGEQGAMTSTEPEREWSPSLVPRAMWNLQHRSGMWRKRLAADDERLRYETLTAVIEGGGRTGTLLDLGCAHGPLLDCLDPKGHAGYLGVDFSPAAIAAGQRAHAGSGARFVAADIRSWSAETTFDSIVFNEILYYFARPCSLVRRYTQRLSTGGVIYVSMYQPFWWREPAMRARINQIWRGLAGEFELAGAFSVRDRKDVELFRIVQISDPRNAARRQTSSASSSDPPSGRDQPL